MLFHENYLIKDEELTNLETVEHSEKYCVIYDYWNSDEIFSRNHITLVLHSTIEYFHHLEKQLKTWQGAISVALLLPNPGPKFREKRVKFSESNRLFKVIVYFIMVY